MAFDHSSNPAFNEKYFDECAGSSEVMTVGGTINKTLILMVIMICSATFTWKMCFEASSSLKTYMVIGIIGSLIASLVTIFCRTAAPISAPIYAVFEGLGLGGVSAMYEMNQLMVKDGYLYATRYSGITMNAFGITMGILLLMLVIYKFEIIKVTGKFKTGLIMATGGIALGYLVSLGASFLGYSSTNFVSSGTCWFITLVIAAVASLNFLLDFDQIERGVAKRAPAYMEWYCAFGLMLTVVWLYLEILKLLGNRRK